MSDTIERLEIDEDLFFSRLIQELRIKEEVRAMTDKELVDALINEVWARSRLWERPSILVDEAITRLKRADTLRRWEERKARRAALKATEET